MHELNWTAGGQRHLTLLCNARAVWISPEISYQVTNENEIGYKLIFVVKFIIFTVHAGGQRHCYIRDSLFKTKQRSFVRICATRNASFDLR